MATKTTTAVVAVRKEIQGKMIVVMAADSLFSNHMFVQEAKNNLKLVKFQNFVIGFSGLAAIQTILNGLASKHKEVISNEKDAAEFSRRLLSEIKPRLEEFGGALTEIGDMVLSTPSQIFILENSGFVMESPQYAATGCGNELLAAVVSALYSFDTPDEASLLKLAETAVETACKLSTGCALPVQSLIVKPENLLQKTEETPILRIKRRYKVWTK